MAAAGTAIVSGVTSVYVGGYASSTYLFQHLGATDDGTAITSYAESARDGNTGVYRNGRVSVLATDLTSQEIMHYRWYVDGQTSGPTSISTTTTTGPFYQYMGINQQHQLIKHRIDDAGTSRTRIVQLTHVGTVERGI